MTKKTKTFWYWFIAIIITLTAVIYQRYTGPTYPKRATIAVNNQNYKLKLVRSLSLDESSEIKLKITDTTIKATLYFRKYPTNNNYEQVPFIYKEKQIDSYIMNQIFNVQTEKGYFAAIPLQPAAGKIQYYFDITDANGTKLYFDQNPIIIRFKGAVPTAVLLPHILAMFIAMLFSTLAGLMAIGKHPRFKFYSITTLVLLVIGGLILGPLVQKYAFGELWTGVPFGWDLTDNKTLIAFIFWLLAVWKIRNDNKYVWVIIAALVLLLVYSIPHSMFGSELNYETGKVITGFITL